MYRRHHDDVNLQSGDKRAVSADGRNAGGVWGEENAPGAAAAMLLCGVQLSYGQHVCNVSAS
jgi:hypothetical protein